MNTSLYARGRHPWRPTVCRGQYPCGRGRALLRQVLATVVLTCALAAGPIWAHHTFSMFDQTLNVELRGTIKEVQWTNPHIWVQLLVTQDDGSVVEWSIEGSSPNGLRRRGWKSSTLQPGMEVSIVTNPLKNGDAGGSLVNVTLPDGTLLGRRVDPEPAR